MKKVFCLLTLGCNCLFTIAQNNTFPSSGNVGIGTTNPLGKLHISTANDYGLTFRMQNSVGGSSTTVGIHAINDASDEWRNLAIDANYIFLNSATGGNVGIGTTAPAVKLDIVGSAMRIQGHNSAWEQNKYLYFGPGTLCGIGQSFVGADQYYTDVLFGIGIGGNKTAFRLLNGSTEVMRANADGNVGIGTSNPGTYKLAVRGAAIFTKVQVKADGAANWPDYVFHSSYNLRSISSLETYINKNKHLPDVPSAEEVEKNGLDMGATQAALLRKIEELTLYIIKQDKKITFLLQENKKIKIIIKNSL